MGYELHITRKKDWSDEEGPRIAAEEWVRLVEGDPTLRFESYIGPYFAIWKGDPDDSEAWIDWSEGDLFSKNPSDALIGKMLEIARRLEARVQGDDGEVYRSASEWFFE